MLKTIVSVFVVLSVLLGTGYNVSDDCKTQTSRGEFIKTLFNKKEIIAEKHTGKPSEETWSAENEYSADYGTTVCKDKNRDFKILNIADIHLSDFGYRIFTGIGAEAVLRELVKETKPDLITLSGDIVCSDSTYYSIRRITDLMESIGIPWAPVFGNHDDEGNCDLNYLCDVMMTGAHCLMKKGDPRMGYGNYVINIAEKDGTTEKIVETIVMTDSHHSQPNEVQSQWVKWVAEGTKKISDGKAELSVFMHIPLPEYQLAYDKYHSDEGWAEESKGFGEMNEEICCERDENHAPNPKGFFDALKSTGNVKYVFCSHEHMNDFSVEYEGIRLTYMMKIGIASGFQPGFDGGTVISIGSSGVKTINHKVLSAFGFKDEETIKIK